MKTKTKILLAKVAYLFLHSIRKMSGKTDRTTVKRGGLTWLLDLKEGIDLAIYLQGRFEPSTSKALERLVKPAQTVLDIGANIGAHTLPLAKSVGPEGKVIAFEPTLYAYDKLVANIKANDEIASRIRAEQIQLGRDDLATATASIYSSWTVVGNGDRHPKHAGELKSTEGAIVRQLDSYLESQGISRVDLIKLDVDGFECDVLAGAEKTLARDHPLICFEIAPYVHEERGSSLDELLGIMYRHGYEVAKEGTSETLPLDKEALAKLVPTGGSINAIGYPMTRQQA